MVSSICFRLTAFVLRCFAQARHYVYIDDNELSSAMSWMIKQQRVDGEFPATGRLINKQMQVSERGSWVMTFDEQRSLFCDSLIWSDSKNLFSFHFLSIFLFLLQLTNTIELLQHFISC